MGTSPSGADYPLPSVAPSEAYLSQGFAAGRALCRNLYAQAKMATLCTCSATATPSAFQTCIR
jgi:hypothetical protein